ncbi:preprotein translocase subunit SecE [uncultured Brevundimonas sp.]|uniref:preprotein translocase subunit SecE n=1 Tax=uncultured Brevundimonas sp. TaxID=213418 RepID=UPI0030EC6F5E|tara:strand:+ start:3468 stop:3758 length:291 start_codon:yes stop_codon:yes gene_type:complete
MAKAKTPGGRRTMGMKTAPAAQTVAVDTPVPKKRVSIPQFFSQVRAEGRKIVWPSRKETWITSVMVFIMVVIASIFFWVVDAGLTIISQYVLAFGQ